MNKGMDMINLPSIFRNEELTSFLPLGLKVQVPTVSVGNESTISRHLFNHNKFSKVCLIVIILFVHVMT